MFFFQENAHQEFINIIDGLQKENPALVDVAIKHYISQVNSRKLETFYVTRHSVDIQTYGTCRFSIPVCTVSEV